MGKNEIREQVCSDVSRILRQKREKRGISMTRLAEQAGLSQSMVSLVERDLRNPTLDTLLRIAEVLNVDVGEIISKARKAALKKGNR